MRTTRKRALTLTAAVASVALLATGCGGGKDDDKTGGSGDGATSDEKVTLTISTFNEWGYDALLDQYMQEHPNVTIDHNKFATSNEARDQFNTSLAAGSGLADVVGVEVDWMPEIMQYSDQFVDLTSDAVKGRWQDWKAAQATDADGRLLGYGTDIGLGNVVHISIASVIGSNLFSNVPFVLIVGHWVKQMSNPQFVWMLLALTSTFAGNLTLFGSVANIIVAQGAEKDSPLRFVDFLKAGIPVTLVTTVVGVFMLWCFQGWGWL